MQTWTKRALAMGLCLAAAAACTTQKPNTGQATEADNSSTVGITADEIHISLITADLSLLAEQHLAPDLGDPTKAAQAAVDDINAHGGVAGGRKLVLTTHEIPNAPLATPDVLQRSCVQATEEDKPAAVIIAAAVPVTVVQCVAVSHNTLAVTMDSWQKSVYDQANGRLVSVGTHLGADIEREYGAFPGLLQTQHALDGKTIGILNQDQPSDRSAAADALKASLAEAGINVAAEATAPYSAGNTSCTQTDTAIQKMKAANVDFVFLVAENLCAASLVGAAKSANFKPQWATLGNNVTDAVAQFFEPAKDNLDGAWGISGSLTTLSKAGNDCAALVEKATGVHYEPSSTAYAFTALTCLQVQTLAEALNTATTPITQGSVIGAFEAMASVPMVAGPPGSLSPTKHDAGDYVWLEKFSAAAGTWALVQPTAQPIP
jgi:ABC-type branched-subunit amino acid transport system substrate-binding protein